VGGKNRACRDNLACGVKGNPPLISQDIDPLKGGKSRVTFIDMDNGRLNP